MTPPPTARCTHTHTHTYSLHVLGTLRLRRLTSCRVVCGPVRGPIYVEGCKDCVIVAAGRQVPCHSRAFCFFLRRRRPCHTVCRYMRWLDVEGCKDCVVVAAGSQAGRVIPYLVFSFFLRRMSSGRTYPTYHTIPYQPLVGWSCRPVGSGSGIWSVTENVSEWIKAC